MRCVFACVILFYWLISDLKPFALHSIIAEQISINLYCTILGHYMIYSQKGGDILHCLSRSNRLLRPDLKLMYAAYAGNRINAPSVHIQFLCEHIE